MFFHKKAYNNHIFLVVIHTYMFKVFWVWEEDNNFKNLKPLDISSKPEQPLDDSGQIALDIVESDDEMLIVAPVAGIDLEDIDIFMNNSVLTIRWSRQKPAEIYAWDHILRNSECFWGKFVRNVILPENLDFNKIKAVMENNLLVLRIPKLRYGSQNIKIDKIEVE